MALGYKGRLLVDVEFQRMMSHTAGPAAAAPEIAFGYWRTVQDLVDELNTGRERSWEQVQASLRHFNSGDDGLLETAELRMGFRLPLSTGPDTMKQLLVSADGVGTFRFSGEETAFRAEKNTPLVRAFVSAVRAYGGEPSFLSKTGTSDMNVVGPAWGCPILAYGPGDSRAGSHAGRARGDRGVGARGGGAGGGAEAPDRGIPGVTTFACRACDSFGRPAARPRAPASAGCTLGPVPAPLKQDRARQAK